MSKIFSRVSTLSRGQRIVLAAWWLVACSLLGISYWLDGVPVGSRFMGYNAVEVCATLLLSGSVLAVSGTILACAFLCDNPPVAGTR